MSIIKGEVNVPKPLKPTVLKLVQCQYFLKDLYLDTVFFHCKERHCVYKEMPNGDLKCIRLKKLEARRG